MFRGSKNTAEAKRSGFAPDNSGSLLQTESLFAWVKLILLFLVIMAVICMIATRVHLIMKAHHPENQILQSFSERSIISPLVDLPALQGALLPKE